MYRVLLICVGAVLLTLTSCDDYDSWTQSPDAVLTFSADTLAFDTVITRHSSTTRTLVVFNRASKGVRIQHVALEQGRTSNFRVNVDGEYLAYGEGDDFEIRARDSMYVRVEVTVPEAGGPELNHLKDYLHFTLENGRTQKVLLTAEGMDVEEHKGLSILNDTTINSPIPLLIYDSLSVAEGAVLTLAPGTTLMFHDGAEVLVRGTLKARGTLEKPITFRSDRVDRMFDYLLYDNTPNRWGGIHIFGSSKENELVQCDIHAGQYGIRCDSTDVANLTLTMENSVIHFVGQDALSLTNCQTRIFGSQISNAGGRCLYICGGAHSFLHCTVAQFYPLESGGGDALYLTNQVEDVYYPLYWCEFYNSIITGRAEDVIMGSIAENEEYKCDYVFDHSLLRTVVSDDELRFKAVRYDVKDSTDYCADKNFTLYDDYAFLYDFTPDSVSTARDMADPQWAELCPVDRFGRNRMADGKPDAGAYEYLPR
ncbi:MAG: right-handed parallel beta-helix repeat-containing protein [Bacteroidaceae bacterium]|nr:right-handed parallel beta-helix repeat-containing protein [Bacteroidaceae bacterium]